MEYFEVKKEYDDIMYFFNKVYNKEHGIMSTNSFQILEDSIFTTIAHIDSLEGWSKVKAQWLKYMLQSLYIKAERAGKW